MKSNALTSIIFFLFFGIYFSASQNVVVSEYYNVSGNPDQEWTELLVIDDNTSLVGYAIRDNAGSAGTPPSSWQGGVRFEDVPLWRNLREGTIIVIHHRGNRALDTDPADGYIEIEGENPTYFEKVCWACDAGTWNDKALNIAQTADMVQLLNGSDSHVHMLAHISDPNSGDYSTAPGPKVAKNGSVSNGYSVRVVPGNSLSDYAAGFNNGQAYASTLSSLGKPNNSSSSTDENQLFWRELRQPDWNSPSLTLTPRASDVLLDWNNCVDPRPSDNTVGYLILRIPTDEIGSAQTPIDGKVYSPGDMLGSATVVDHVFPSTTSEYIDPDKIDCDKEITYRIYAFRYSADDGREDTRPVYGRGRSYNEEDFAEETASNPDPQRPQIILTSGIAEFCEGDSARLKANYSGGPYEFQWLLDGDEIPGATYDFIWAKESGRYKVRINNEFDCESTSDYFEIQVVDKPTARIYVNDVLVFADTTVKICANGELALSAGGGFDFYWYENDQLVQTSTQGYNASREGTYFCQTLNGESCTDTSVSVTLQFIEVDFDIDPKYLIFDLDETQSSEDKTVTITNNANDTLTIYDHFPPQYFILVAPPLPIDIAPGESRDLTIRFAPGQSGTFTGDFNILTSCDGDSIITVEGHKEKTTISAVPQVEFATMIDCEVAPKDTTIIVENSSTDDFELLAPVIAPPFEVISPSFPKVLSSGNSEDIVVRYSPGGAGNYSVELKIPYINGLNADTLRILLDGSVETASFVGSVSSIDLGSMNECEEFAETGLAITNDGDVPITISTDPAAPEVEFTNLPLSVEPGRSEQLEIRVSPPGDGAFSYPVQILAQPCDISFDLTISGFKQGYVYSFKSDTVDFGTIVQCANSGDAAEEVFLSITGGSGDRPRIKSFNVGEDFDADLTDGTELTDDEFRFNVIFIDNSYGEFFDSLVVVFEPCDREEKIYLRGERIDPEYTISTDDIDFGNLLIPVDETRTLTVDNVGKVAITVDGIDGIADPFFVNSATTFPLEILPGESEDILIDYLRNETSEDELFVDLSISVPCELESAFRLAGSSFSEDQSIRARAYFDGPFESEVNRALEAPLYLTENEPEIDFADARIERIEFRISYDPSLLIPERYSAGAYLNEAGIVNLDYAENPPGKLEINLDLNEEADVGSGEFLVVTFRSLLGSSLGCELSVDSARAVSALPIFIEGDTTNYVLSGGCKLEERLVEISGTPRLSVQIRDGSIATATFKTVVDSPTAVEIYDSFGRLLDSFDAGNAARESSFDFDVSAYASGMYYAVMRNGEVVRIAKFGKVE